MASYLTRAECFARLPLVAMLSCLACITTTPGATEADLAIARQLASAGAIVFSKQCARCHGEHGEGLAGAPAILGSGALPEYPRDSFGPDAYAVTDPTQLQVQIETRPAGAPSRDPFRTAQDLHDFTTQHRPPFATGVKPEDYWAVVTFMIAVQGGQPPVGGINPNNAPSIAIPGH